MNAGFSNESIGGYGSAFGGGFGGWGGYPGWGMGGYGCNTGFLEMILLFSLLGGRGNFFGRDGCFDRAHFEKETGCNWSDFHLLLKDAINNKTEAVEEIAERLGLGQEFIKQCCCDVKCKLEHVDEKIGHESEKLGWKLGQQICDTKYDLKSAIDACCCKTSKEMCDATDKVLHGIQHASEKETSHFGILKDTLCDMRNENTKEHFATRLEIERTEGRLSRQAEHNKDAIINKLVSMEINQKDEKIHALQERLERAENQKDFEKLGHKIDKVAEEQREHERPRGRGCDEKHEEKELDKITCLLGKMYEEQKENEQNKKFDKIFDCLDKISDKQTSTDKYIDRFAGLLVKLEEEQKELGRCIKEGGDKHKNDRKNHND